MTELQMHTCPVCEQVGCVVAPADATTVQVVRACPYRDHINPRGHVMVESAEAAARDFARQMGFDPEGIGTELIVGSFVVGSIFGAISEREGVPR